MKNVFTRADILIPSSADMTKRSVVACDQYTSQPEYWERVSEFVGDSPSTRKIIFPEVYLETADSASTIASINSTMEKYLPIMKTYESSVILVKRKFPSGQVRTGLIGAIDLEEYDYNKGSVSLVRATEGTVLERIPPRVLVRENALLESPHIMLLIDDEEKSVIEPISEKCSEFECVYNFELMENGGHIEGYRLSDDVAETVCDELNSLIYTKAFAKKQNSAAPLLFAVGDGNHSLATAKACYDNLKASLGADAALAHPARYALVEVVNLHEPSLVFEPIHRVIFDCDAKNLIDAFREYNCNSKSDYTPQSFRVITEHGEETVVITNPTSNLEVGTLQNFLNEYQKEHAIKIDYVHGDNVTRELGSRHGNAGFILPPMQKSALFETVIKDGVLPRKTFSMGEANEKRFYLECRKIK